MVGKHTSKKSILCVDPDARIRPLLEQGLDKSQIHIIGARDGAAAVQALEAMAPDIVISGFDAGMYSGADLALLVAGFSHKKIPFLLVFPDDTQDAAEIAKLCSADNYVVGLPTPSTLAALVNSLFAQALLHHKIRYFEERLRRTQAQKPTKSARASDDIDFMPLDIFKRVLLTEAKRSSRYHLPLGVVLIGFDAYLPLRARYGEAALGPMFQDMSKLILRVVRDIDTPVRVSPDSVLVMLPHTDPQGAKRVGDRLCGQARLLRVDVGGERARSTVSVGVAGFDGAGQVGFADLMRRARAALENVRQRGGDGIELR